MKTAVIKAWSYSRWQEWFECALKYYFRNIQKIAEPRGPALLHGEDVHDVLELYVLKKQSKLRKDVATAMGKLKDSLDAVRKIATPEQSAWFDKNWRLIRTDDWDNVWLRVQIDLIWTAVYAVDKTRKFVVEMRDYKTGKINEAKHADQLELYVIYGFVKYPDADEVVAAPWYVDHGFAGAPKVFKRSQLEGLKRKWERRVAPMIADTKFRAKVGGHCKWCPYSGRRTPTPGPCTKG